MESLKDIYLKNINLLNNFQNNFFDGIEFNKLNYDINALKKIKIKKLFKELDDGIEIKCKELIKNKWNEKILEIVKYYNKKDYEKYVIIINNERSIFYYEKYKSNKKIYMSKQYINNGEIVSIYNDSNNNYILHQNINNSLCYIDMFDNNILNCNIFKYSDDNIEYISKFPCNFIYKIINNKSLEKDELYNLFNLENQKRKSLNIELLNIEVDDKIVIDNYIEKINLVKDNTKNLYENFENNILDNTQIKQIIDNNKKLDESKNNEVKEIENIDYEENEDLSELEILKNQKNELIKIKDSTNEIIRKLQIILNKSENA